MSAGVRRIKAGTTGVRIRIRIIDSIDGTPETAVVWNSTGIDLWYQRDGAAVVHITEATLAALTTAWTSGGFLAVQDGWYNLDLPDAACAVGVPGVQIGGTVTGMVVLAPYIELPLVDQYDAVRGGMTALPAALPGAAGGVFIAGTNAATTVSTAFTATFTGNLTGSVASVTGNLGGSVGSLGVTAKADVNAEVVDAIAVDARNEPPQEVPGVSISMARKIDYLYKDWRNRKTMDAGILRLFADDGSTVDQKRSVVDNDVTCDRGEVTGGP